MVSQTSHCLLTGFRLQDSLGLLYQEHITPVLHSMHCLWAYPPSCHSSCTKHVQINCHPIYLTSCSSLQGRPSLRVASARKNVIPGKLELHVHNSPTLVMQVSALYYKNKTGKGNTCLYTTTEIPQKRHSEVESSFSWSAPDTAVTKW